MADRASASTIIGGRVRRSTIPRLIRAIEGDNGLKDWDGEPIDHNSIVSGELLDVYAFDLPGGIFESVESFCELNKIAFVLSSGSCSGAFGPERVVFDGLDSARHYELNESDEVVLTRRELADLGSLETANAWFASAEYMPAPIDLVDDMAGLGAKLGANREAEHG